MTGLTLQFLAPAADSHEKGLNQALPSLVATISFVCKGLESRALVSIVARASEAGFDSQGCAYDSDAAKSELVSVSQSKKVRHQ